MKKHQIIFGSDSSGLSFEDFQKEAVSHNLLFCDVFKTFCALRHLIKLGQWEQVQVHLSGGTILIGGRHRVSGSFDFFEPIDASEERLLITQSPSSDNRQAYALVDSDGLVVLLELQRLA